MSTNNNSDFATVNTKPLREDLEKVKEKAIETKDAIAQAATHAKTEAGKVINKSYEDASEKAQQFYSEAKDKTQQLYSEAKDKTADMQENVITYVQENPLKSLGFAVLAGALVAQLLR